MDINQSGLHDWQFFPIVEHHRVGVGTVDVNCYGLRGFAHQLHGLGQANRRGGHRPLAFLQRLLLGLGHRLLGVGVQIVDVNQSGLHDRQLFPVVEHHRIRAGTVDVHRHGLRGFANQLHGLRQANGRCGHRPLAFLQRLLLRLGYRLLCVGVQVLDIHQGWLHDRQLFPVVEHHRIRAGTVDVNCYGLRGFANQLHGLRQANRRGSHRPLTFLQRLLLGLGHRLLGVSVQVLDINQSGLHDWQFFPIVEHHRVGVGAVDVNCYGLRGLANQLHGLGQPYGRCGHRPLAFLQRLLLRLGYRLLCVGVQVLDVHQGRLHHRQLLPVVEHHRIGVGAVDVNRYGLCGFAHQLHGLGQANRRCRHRPLAFLQRLLLGLGHRLLGVGVQVLDVHQRGLNNGIRRGYLRRHLRNG